MGHHLSKRKQKPLATPPPIVGLSQTLDTKRVQYSPEIYLSAEGQWVEGSSSVERPPSSIRVLTWNIDFVTPALFERTECILNHIQRYIFHCPTGEAPVPCCILLQEVNAEIFPQLLGFKWVQDHFQVMPTSNKLFPLRSRYGNVTLVSRSIQVTSVSSLVFLNSNMARNALLVDVTVGVPGRTIRFANSHLESLSGHGTIVRPIQMKLITGALKEPGVFAGILCGDMNCNEDTDKNTPREVGLVDAFIGSDDDIEAHTFGYQSRDGSPPCRLDKVLYTPRPEMLVDAPVTKIGAGLKAGPDGGQQWASDHFGVMTSVQIAADVE